MEGGKQMRSLLLLLLVPSPLGAGPSAAKPLLCRDHLGREGPRPTSLSFWRVPRDCQTGAELGLEAMAGWEWIEGFSRFIRICTCSVPSPRAGVCCVYRLSIIPSSCSRSSQPALSSQWPEAESLGAAQVLRATACGIAPQLILELLFYHTKRKPCVYDQSLELASVSDLLPVSGVACAGRFT